MPVAPTPRIRLLMFMNAVVAAAEAAAPAPAAVDGPFAPLNCARRSNNVVDFDLIANSYNDRREALASRGSRQADAERAWTYMILGEPLKRRGV